MTQAEVLSQFHHYLLDPKDLAQWLDAQEGTWWAVDGDPLLTSRMSFPCPADELADRLRRIDRPLELFHSEAPAPPPEPRIGGADLDRLADTDNNPQERTFLLRWQGDEEAWLLGEDKVAQKAFS